MCSIRVFLSILITFKSPYISLDIRPAMMGRALAIIGWALLLIVRITHDNTIGNFSTKYGRQILPTSLHAWIQSFVLWLPRWQDIDKDMKMQSHHWTIKSCVDIDNIVCWWQAESVHAWPVCGDCQLNYSESRGNILFQLDNCATTTQTSNRA